MKKYLLLILFVAPIIEVYGQDRHIVMPEQPKDSYNIAEEDKG